MTHVFISYARKEGKELAFKLYGSFSALAGWSAWLDTDIHAPNSFGAEIEREIKRADLVVVVLSPDVERPESFVRREIAFAQLLKKPIFPVRASRAMPPVDIAHLTWLDFFGVSYRATFAELLDMIGRALSLGTAAAPTPQPQPRAPQIVAPPSDPRLDFEWCEVPAGPFKMGGDPDAWRAWNGAEFVLDYTF